MCAVVAFMLENRPWTWIIKWTNMDRHHTRSITHTRQQTPFNSKTHVTSLKRLNGMLNWLHACWECLFLCPRMTYSFFLKLVEKRSRRCLKYTPQRAALLILECLWFLWWIVQLYMRVKCETICLLVSSLACLAVYNLNCLCTSA